MLLKDILTNVEEEQLKKLLTNKALLNGLRKVFLSNIYYSGTLGVDEKPDPRRNFICQLLYNEDMSMDYNLSDERLGQKTRASVEAIRLVEQSFKEIEGLDIKPIELGEKKNPAR